MRARVKQTDQIPSDYWMNRQSRQLIASGELRTHSRFLAPLPPNHRLAGMKNNVQQTTARSGRFRLHD